MKSHSHSTDPLVHASLPAYVLISPARNEAAFIEKTIQSVIAQTYLPLRWVIVSDGSTDGTDEIVKKYLPDHPWMKLVRMPERKERNFAGKVHAFNAGRERLAGLEYDVIGNLDADITMDEGYFDFLLRKFVEYPQLGVAGTPFREGDHQYDYRFTRIEHVSGACQLFRRECFEQIGGYKPIKTGGVDLVALMTARMKGWQTRTFLEKHSRHHRQSQTHSAKRSLASAFRDGRSDYILGCDPSWQFLRCVSRLRTQRPIVLAPLCFAGYVWAMMTRTEKAVSKELVRFRRTEERHRLSEILLQALSRRASKSLDRRSCGI
jgi:poly-beta-1,6-N-acetyl-D-glucosamine synthase